MIKLPHHILDEERKDLAIRASAERLIYDQGVAHRLPCSLHQGEKRKVYEHSVEPLKIHRKASVKYPMPFLLTSPKKSCIIIFA